MNKMSSAIISLLLIITILLSGCKSIAPINGSKDNSSTNIVSSSNDITQPNSTSEYNLKDDFYNYVNAEWINNQTLDGIAPSISNFQNVGNSSFSQIYYVLTEAISKDVDKGDDDFAKLTKFYKTSIDFNSRNNDSVNPIIKYIDKIKSISTIEEAQLVASELDMNMIGNFMMFGINPDLKDSTTNRLYLAGPVLSLGDKSYYSDESERGIQVIDAYKDMLKKLLILTGESESDAVNIAESAFYVEKELASSVLSSYESMKESLTYNKFDLDEFAAKYKNFDIKGFLSRVKLENPEFIIVTETNYYDKLDEIMVEKNLEGIKNFMYTQALIQTADYLTSDHLLVLTEFKNIFNGTTGARDETDAALTITQNYLGEIMGKVYVENFFSHDAKEEVEKMTYTIIDSYKNRIKNLWWMSQDTKKSAIKKLDTMSVKIGYPDNWTDYSSLTVTSYEDGGSLFENVVNNYTFEYNDFLASLDQPVDRSAWSMDAHEANAYYSPSLNEIVFPAGILKAPFFDINASESQNYGAIGAIIAHEISHAFDESGSQYDEFGNLSNWWTEEDRTNYESLTKKLVDLFDGYEIIPGYSVDGNFTLDENIADLGGVSCIVGIVRDLPDGNLDETFTSFAKIWASKSTDDYKKNLIVQDPHAPDMLRVNLLLPNIDEFYETYNITEKDGMFIPKENRIQIW